MTRYGDNSPNALSRLHTCPEHGLDRNDNLPNCRDCAVATRLYQTEQRVAALEADQ